MYKVLRPADSDFRFSPDGIVVVPRAAFEIGVGCPQMYQDIIAECLRHGWLRPVAYMRDPEYTMELLHK